MTHDEHEHEHEGRAYMRPSVPWSEISNDPERPPSLWHMWSKADTVGLVLVLAVLALAIRVVIG